LLNSLGSLLLPLLSAVTLAAALSSVNAMTWRSDSRLLLVTYLPAALASALIAPLRAKGGWERVAKGRVALLALLLALLAGLGVRSAYVIAVWLASAMAAAGIARIFGLAGTARALAVLVCGSALPFAYTVQVANTTLLIFIPVMGRSGSNLNPDVFLSILIGLFSSLSLFLPLSLLAPSSSASSDKAANKATNKAAHKAANEATNDVSGMPAGAVACVRLTGWLLGACAIASAYMVSQREPYSSERPKQMFVQHFRRRLHSADGAVKEETGLLINAMDYKQLAPVNALPSQRFKDVTPYWCESLACQMPCWFPLASELHGAWVLPAAAPPIPQTLELSATFSHVTSPNDQGVTSPKAPALRRVHVTVLGPAYKGAVLEDPDRRIEGWSYAPQVEASVRHSAEHKHSLFLFHAEGGASPDPRNWSFWIDVRGPALIEVSIWGHHLSWRDETGGRDDSGCGFSRDATSFKRALPEHMAPICFYDDLVTYPV